MFIKKIVIMIGFIFSASIYATEECSLKKVVGKFINPAYNSEFYKAEIEIKEVTPEVFQLIFNVPCDTKINPKVFEITSPNYLAGDLKLINIGSSQRDTGGLYCNGTALTNSDGKVLLTYTYESSCQDTVQSLIYNKF